MRGGGRIRDRGPVPARFRRICQERLPAVPWQDPALARLPGLKPLVPDDWPWEDEVFARQMAFRDWLRRHEAGRVFAAGGAPAQAAAEELKALVLGRLQGRPGWCIAADRATRPDGETVPLKTDHPLAVAGRLVQSDLCLLLPEGDGLALAAAFLAFPAAWRLDEKLGRPLAAIHGPVAAYDADLARRVDRMFGRLPPGRPVWRMNRLAWPVPCLFHPDPLPGGKGGGPWLRAERQLLLRLPRTGALLFAIHTTVMEARRLDGRARRGIPPDLAAALGLVDPQEGTGPA